MHSNSYTLTFTSIITIFLGLMLSVAATSLKPKQEKNIEVSIERIIENDEDLTKVVVRGQGDITRKELEEELDRMLEKQGINKNKTKLNVEMKIES